MPAITQIRTRRLMAFVAAVAALAALVALRTVTTSSAQVVADVTVDLCAKEGTVGLPGTPSVPIWGFASKPSGVPCSDSAVEAGLPGPVLEASDGDLVEVNVTNELADPVSVDFPGIDVDPGPTEAAPGATVSYTFTAAPGTYVYESGADAGRQAAMGLYGALVVRPSTPGQAYNDPSTAYDSEAVAVLSEIDTGFNADPAGFDLLDWKPKYWLINGEAYPDTNAHTINAAPGDRVLLRYVNPGPENVTMTMLGLHARLLASDAFQVQAPFEFVAQTIAAGQTVDALVTVPPSAAAGDRFPLYNRQLHLTNGSLGNPQHSPGGMLTFIEVQ
jgi:FtsP/CotA-like multicopper oxidase with cupredoxin domain